MAQQAGEENTQEYLSTGLVMAMALLVVPASVREAKAVTEVEALGEANFHVMPANGLRFWSQSHCYCSL